MLVVGRALAAEALVHRDVRAGRVGALQDVGAAQVARDDRARDGRDERRAVAGEEGVDLGAAGGLELAPRSTVGAGDGRVFLRPEVLEGEDHGDVAVLVALVEELGLDLGRAAAVGRAGHEVLVEVAGREHELHRSRPALDGQGSEVAGQGEHGDGPVVPDRVHAVGVARDHDAVGALAGQRRDQHAGAGQVVGGGDSDVRRAPAGGQRLELSTLVGADVDRRHLPVCALVGRVLALHLGPREPVDEDQTRRALYTGGVQVVEPLLVAGEVAFVHAARRRLGGQGAVGVVVAPLDEGEEREGHRSRHRVAHDDLSGDVPPRERGTGRDVHERCGHATGRHPADRHRGQPLPQRGNERLLRWLSRLLVYPRRCVGHGRGPAYRCGGGD